MKTEIVSELKTAIEGIADVLAESNEDSMLIKGVDNQILVKLQSTLAQEMLNSNRVLFPYSNNSKEYLVCIAEVRRS